MPADTAKTCRIDGFSRTRERCGGGWDEGIAELAGRQHGVVSRRQLLGLGIGRDAVQDRLELGRLHPIHAGVYAVGHRVLSRRARWMAAILAGADGAVLSHRSAAALWEIRSPHRGRIEVTLPWKSRSTDRIHRRFARLPHDEMTIEAGIPVTTVPRTLFDLAAVSHVDQVESALRQSEYLRLHDRLSLPDLLARYPAHRGVRAIRTCLARRAELPAGTPRSPLEERFLPFLREHGLPRPRLNALVTARGRNHEVDCLWPQARQIVELDGFAGHGTRGAFREDRARDRRLRVAGYAVTRIAWAQLDDEPEPLAADLRALLSDVQTSVITYTSP